MSDGDPFTHLSPMGYWTSTYSVADPVHAFVFNPMQGGETPVKSKDIAVSFPDAHVWLVRASAKTALAPIPATGQTTCSDYFSGAPLSCAATGQDGDLRAGVPLPSPRFTDNGNGAITDNLTGLMWLKEANCIGDRLPGLDIDGAADDGAVTWQHGFEFVAGLNYGIHDCGQSGEYTDWRLPNFRELDSLVNLQYHDPAISHTLGKFGQAITDPFVGVESARYWTSSTYMYFNTDPAAWAIDMSQGIGSGGGGIKTGNNYVWPVRSGN